jgi:S1-C subfamily serine protease
MRRIDWIMIISLVILALGGEIFSLGEGHVNPHAHKNPTENPRRPSPKYFGDKIWDKETQDWLYEGPTQSQNENPAFAQLPEIGTIAPSLEHTSSVGSAFAISKQGLWLTAKHVVTGCDKEILQIGNKKALKINTIDFHPQADIALLTTRGAAKPLNLLKSTKQLNHAFGIGFPTGQPGAVHARYIGEMTMHHRGRNGFKERVHAWSEQSRIPNRSGSLGGLSGGALINDQGNIIGIVQAESRRRGRIMTAKPEAIQKLFEMVSANSPSSTMNNTEFSLSPDDYPKIARQLITSLRVAKVHCFVK